MNEIIYALSIEVVGHFLVYLLAKTYSELLFQKIKKNWKKIIQVFKNFISKD